MISRFGNPSKKRWKISITFKNFGNFLKILEKSKGGTLGKKKFI